MEVAVIVTNFKSSKRSFARKPPQRAEKSNRNKPSHQKARKLGGEGWIWGFHPCHAALQNPKRQINQLYLTKANYQRLETLLHEKTLPQIEVVEADFFDRNLPQNAVHQGIIANIAPLPEVFLDDIFESDAKCALMLDQVTDPHNVGAIFRSAAAFGADAIIQQQRHAPAVTGALAKASVGAIEQVADIREVNLARTIEYFNEAGWLSIGLSGDGPLSLSAAKDARPILLVLGAEGAGLRPAVAKACQTLARIPMLPDMESLNVSNAAAIALYEIFNR